jgi:uncharacterized protein YgiM (DUF1202 family)
MTITTTKRRHPTPRRHGLLAVAAAAAAAGVLLAAPAARAADAEVQVFPRAAEVVAEKSVDSDTVEAVSPGQRLTVLEESDGWLRVRTPAGKEGYIWRNQVKSSKEPNFFNKVGSAIVGGDATASKTSAANAGRGMTEEARQYALSKGYDTTGPDKMIALRQAYKPQVKQFAQDGRVGGRK